MNDTLQLAVVEQSEVAIVERGIVERGIVERIEDRQEDPRQIVLQQASERFQQAPDWVAFFREVLGVDGVIRKMFSAPVELLAFEQSPEYAQVQQMLAKLRERKEEPNAEIEPTRVITVRLPKSVHEYLKAEAHDRHTSMNKLCISKLLQMIDNELVPGD